MADDDIRAVTKYAATIPFSREIIAEAEEWHRAIDEWASLTSEQQEQRQREVAERRAAERAASVPVALTLDDLIRRLGWPRTFAEHVVQPYCECYDGSDGWVWCAHADDLRHELWPDD